ncbi:MAG: TrmH family RNA methyltransferase, partial [Myxococcota bacterium]
DQPDARKFANHAKEALLAAPHFESVRAAVHDCDWVIGTSGNRRQRGLIQPLGPENLAERTGGMRRVGLVFGNEAAGLDNDELRDCQAILHLPTFSDYTSYNLSHAVAISVFALRAANSTRSTEFDPLPEMESPATQGELSELADSWLRVLERFGYFRRTHRDRFAPKLRAMLGRLRPARHDTGLIRGMLAHFELFAPDPDGSDDP